MGLLAHHFDTAFAAPDGIQKLRELILTLAMQGKLVPQDPNDQPASELLKAIELEKQPKIHQSKLVPEIKLDDLPHKLPNAWEWVRLGNVFDLKSGCSFPKEDELESGKYMYLKVGEMNLKGNERVITSASIFLDDSKKVVNSLIPANSIIFPKRGGAIATNKKRLVIEPICVDTNIMAIVCPDSIELAFAYHWILSLDLAILNTGTSVPQINNKDVSPLLFPVPPLAEQRRIVAKIDQLMARCDELEKLRSDRAQKLITVHTAAIAHLLTAQDSDDFTTAWRFITQHFGQLYSVKETVAELRKTILQLAVMGKLVPQDPNDEPASELLKELELEKQRLVKEGKIKKTKPLPNIQSDEIAFDLPKGWEQVRLGEVVDFTTGKLDSNAAVKNGQYPFFTCAKESLLIDHYAFDCETILLAGNNAAGKYNVKHYKGKFNAYQRTYVITVEFGQRKVIDYRYLKYLLENMLDDLQSKSLGTLTQFLTLGILKPILISLPPLSEQHRIVTKVDQLMALCDRLEEAIETAQAKQTDLLNAVMAQV